MKVHECVSVWAAPGSWAKFNETARKVWTFSRCRSVSPEKFPAHALASQIGQLVSSKSVTCSGFTTPCVVKINALLSWVQESERANLCKVVSWMHQPDRPGSLPEEVR